LNRLACHRALLVLAHGGNGWDEDTCWDVTSMATALAALSANHVGADLEALRDVLGVPDHVHIKYAIFVKLVHDSLWWDTDSRHKELGTALDNNVDEIVQLAFRVVVTEM